MLIENEHFDADNALPSMLRDDVFRTSTFDGLEIEGVTFDGIIESCQFAICELYWMLFNCTLVAGVRFECCQFRSASFRGATFVECEFVECTFNGEKWGHTPFSQTSR